METSCFTGRLLAHNICPTTVLTFTCACMVMKRKGLSFTHLLHGGEENVKIYSPKKKLNSWELRPREISFFWRNKSFIFPEHSCYKLFYYTEQDMIMQNKSISIRFLTFWKEWRLDCLIFYDNVFSFINSNRRYLTWFLRY